MQRLRLIEVLGACFAKNQLLSSLGYSFPPINAIDGDLLGAEEGYLREILALPLDSILDGGTGQRKCWELGQKIFDHYKAGASGCTYHGKAGTMKICNAIAHNRPGMDRLRKQFVVYTENDSRTSFGCACIPDFRSVKLPPISNRGSNFTPATPDQNSRRMLCQNPILESFSVYAWQGIGDSRWGWHFDPITWVRDPDFRSDY